MGSHLVGEYIKIRVKGGSVMFDPTIYENLKVVIEGSIYDHDSEGLIFVSGREDSIDLASLSRRYSISFQEQGNRGPQYATATISLHAHVRDLASEILETASPETEIGCKLFVSFQLHIQKVEETFAISQKLYSIWDFPPKITQTVSYEVSDGLVRDKQEEKSADGFNVIVQLDFLRKVNEQQIVDINEITRLTIVSLNKLNEHNEKK